MTFVKKIHTKDSPADHNYANDLENRIELGFTNILLFMNPIGTIYQSVNNVNPSTFLGGTWEEFAKGRTLVGIDITQTEFNTVEKTGGAKTHKLTIEEMPKHRMTLDAPNGSGPYETDGVAQVEASSTKNSWGAKLVDTRYIGEDKHHNNLQPYITVYMWKRTA